MLPLDAPPRLLANRETVIIHDPYEDYAGCAVFGRFNSDGMTHPSAAAAT
jgi:hypothetical protein